MKKLLTFTALAALLSFTAATTASAQVYENGKNYLNLGLGLGTYGGGGVGFGASFEHGFTDAISAGGVVGFSSHSYGFGTDYRYTFYFLGARGSYHLNELLNITSDKVDLYAGLGLGFRGYSDNISGTYSSNYGSGLLLLAHAGARYMFSPKVGGFAELGAGISTLQLGVTFKL